MFNWLFTQALTIAYHNLLNSFALFKPEYLKQIKNYQQKEYGYVSVFFVLNLFNLYILHVSRQSEIEQHDSRMREGDRIKGGVGV